MFGKKIFTEKKKKRGKTTAVDVMSEPHPYACSNALIPVRTAPITDILKNTAELNENVLHKDQLSLLNVCIPLLCLSSLPKFATGSLSEWRRGTFSYALLRL